VTQIYVDKLITK